MPVILATWKAEIRRIEVRGQPREIVHETPPASISKITRAKWTVVVAQAAEDLLCKPDSLSSKYQSHQRGWGGFWSTQSNLKFLKNSEVFLCDPFIQQATDS
jgi:hypothetical protein